ncbi:MAG: 50S ribosomal protein L23 [Candidatus Pacearchaeota archaeon]
MKLKPISTEKAIMIIETKNTLVFETEKERKKEEIKKEIETLFGVKIEKMGTLIHKNKKRVYVRLKKEYPAIDVATKLGLI